MCSMIRHRPSTAAVCRQLHASHSCQYLPCQLRVGPRVNKWVPRNAVVGGEPRKKIPGCAHSIHDSSSAAANNAAVGGGLSLGSSGYEMWFTKMPTPLRAPPLTTAADAGTHTDEPGNIETPISCTKRRVIWHFSTGDSTVENAADNEFLEISVLERFRVDSPSNDDGACIVYARLMNRDLVLAEMNHQIFDGPDVTAGFLAQPFTILRPINVKGQLEEVAICSRILRGDHGLTNNSCDHLPVYKEVLRADRVWTPPTERDAQNYLQDSTFMKKTILSVMRRIPKHVLLHATSSGEEMFGVDLFMGLFRDDHHQEDMYDDSSILDCPIGLSDDMGMFGIF